MTVLTDLPTRTICFRPNLTTPYLPEVLLILLLLSGKCHLKNLICGSTTEMVLLMLVLAQVEVHMCQLALTMVGRLGASMAIRYKVGVHTGQLLSGSKLEKQWVMILCQQIYMLYKLRFWNKNLLHGYVLLILLRLQQICTRKCERKPVTMHA